MAVSIIRGTIFKSLRAFEMELIRHLKASSLEKNGHGVIVSILSEGGYEYLHHGSERHVLVTGKEDSTVTVQFLFANTVIGRKVMKFPFITEANEAVLQYLVNNVQPTFE